MKQHINYTDFKSVDDDTFEEMAKLWFREEYKDLDCFADKSKGYWLRQREKDKNFMHEFTKYFTIGKMIEILDSELDDLEIIRDYQRDLEQNKYKCFWIEIIKKGEDHKESFEEKELCDALWEAVKEILND